MTGAALIVQGDALRLPLPDSSVDAICTDPPYSLSFMGRKWDSFGGPQAFQAWCQQWAIEALRVLKPGGWLLACGGTRTWHRLACGIEDAGFEMRDTIAEFGPAYGPLAYLYGSGFPKSLDVAKAIDKAAGAQREVIGQKITGNAKQRTNGTGEFGSWAGSNTSGQQLVDVTAPATPEAERWQGWGTSLKPAWEPVIVARKPLSGTVAQNVLQWGTGALNIDASRVSSGVNPSIERRTQAYSGHPGQPGFVHRGSPERYAEQRPGEQFGRWPPNVALVHDPGCVPVGVRKVRSGEYVGRNRNGDKPSSVYGTLGTNQPDMTYADPDGTETVQAWQCVEDSCPVFLLDQQSGERPPPWGGPTTYSNSGGYGGQLGRNAQGPLYYDQGGASRFYPTFQAESRLFYTAKAPRNERVTIDGDSHPTVKPLDLMRWLVRLVTPPGGLILDMFGGSGTTGEAAMLEGFTAIIIDKDPASCAKAKVRAHPLVRRRVVVTGPLVGPEQGSLL